MPANTLNGACGLQPHINSTMVSLNVRPFYIPNNLAYSFAKGTPVTLTGTSNTSSSINGYYYTPGSLSALARATGGDGNKLVGSIAGVYFNPANLNAPAGGANPSNTEAVALVAMDPNQEFLCAANDVLPAASIGLNANLVIGTVNTQTGVDSTAFDVATAATTATFQIKILRAFDSPGNDVTKPFALYVCKINNHLYSNVVAGV